MAGRGYAAEEREQTRVYTPSMDSDDEFPQISRLSLNDRDYRMFTFRKEGRSWSNALCSESTIAESEIKKRARRTKKPTHTVEHQLDKMSPVRREAVEDLVDRTQRKSPESGRWDIVAIDNDNPQLTKRTGEVTAFSVILARASANRQRTGSMSQERRGSTYLPPRQEFAVPGRRGSKFYHQHQRSPDRDNRSARQSGDFRNSQTILEDDDPFGSAKLFSPDGKPVNAQGSTPFSNLPPHIPLDEPIGAKPQKQKEKSNKKSKINNDADIVDLDALLGDSGFGGHDDHNDLLGDEVDHDHEHVLDFGSPIEVIGDDDYKPARGRKRNDSGWGEKTPKQGMSRSKSKSKSKPRRPSIHIPRDQFSRAVPEVIPGGRRTEKPYWGSHGSANAPSIHSDQSVFEAEYEEYSSSGSSAGWEQQDAWRGQYMPSDGRYSRATRDHRRGPPSPQQMRYDTAPEYARRPSRTERFPSDNQIQRYSYGIPSTSRPPLIQQYSAPRFTPTPMSAHPSSSLYNNYDSGIVPYPGEMQAPTRRRDSMQAAHAEVYIQQERNKDYEIEMLKRERDLAKQAEQLAKRESELHQEVARRAGVSSRTGTSKYSHEPRLSRRYTERGVYHD